VGPEAGVWDPAGRVVFFPVRHHSPAGARLVRRLARALRPAAVLIEGPSDFNPRLDELALPHQLPIAIYSYLRLPDGTARGAFYPFCVYSPEWQALQAARELGCPAEFIDLPWAALARDQRGSHRYADGELRRSRYIPQLCRNLGVEDFDALWDRLFEVDPRLSVEGYLQRAHQFCYHARTLDRAVPAADVRREAFMAGRVRAALDRLGPAGGPILVVTGGFHAYALYARLWGLPFEQVAVGDERDAGDQGGDSRDGLEAQGGIALTPYTYERLDGLSGYDAGMPSPGFYHAVWEARAAQGGEGGEGGEAPADLAHLAYRGLLERAVSAVRARGQSVSTADLIAVEALAGGLAALRGHEEVWRRDVVDGITGALIKDEVEGGLVHPLLEAVYETFRSQERGALAGGTALPPPGAGHPPAPGPVRDSGRAAVTPRPDPAGDPSAAVARQRLLRWRLVLGSGAEEVLGGLPDEDWAAREEALGYLYDREYGPGRNVRLQGGGAGQGGLEPSRLTVPEWINAVHQLFPRRTIERIERDALECYGLEEMVTNPDLLRRARPSPTLLKAVLRTKHLMNAQVLDLARSLVRQTVEELMERLARPVQAPFQGAINRRTHSPLRVASNFDARTTVRRNLHRYDPQSGRLVLERPYFSSRVRRDAGRWRLIILVDESGSMLDSVIHAAVRAAIFFGLKGIKTHLCLFDTAVVDVTQDCTDPVQTLMQVQLGGGTDIGQAVAYAASLVDDPWRTIVVLISDFFEGAPQARLLSTVKALVESGVTLLGLAALDESARPRYDRGLAQLLVDLGGPTWGP
jgi:Mg-chelatase subunit ChlD